MIGHLQQCLLQHELIAIGTGVPMSKRYENILYSFVIMVDYHSDLEATSFIDYLYNNICLRKVLSDRRTKNTGGPLSVYTPRMQCIDPPHPLHKE